MSWRRFIGTWALTVSIFLLWAISRQFPPSKADYESYLWLAFLAGVTSFVAVWMLARLPYLAPTLVVSIANGFFVAYLLGTVTYGDEGELMHGLLVRAIGGALVGLLLRPWLGPCTCGHIAGRPRRRPSGTAGSACGASVAS